MTSEPIPSELGIPVVDSMDLHLSEIPDLSEAEPHLVTPGDGVPRGGAARAASRPVMLNMPTKPGSRNAVVTHLATLSKADLPPPLPPPPQAPQPPPPLQPPGPLLAPAQSGELPLPAPPPTVPEVLPNRMHPMSGPDAPTLLTPPRPSAPGLPHGDAGARRSGAAIPSIAPGPGSGGHALPGSGGHALSSSGAQAALAASGALAAHASLVEDRPPRSWPMIAVIGAAALIGSLTVWIVMKTGAGGATSADAAASAVAGSDAPLVEPVPGPGPGPGPVVTEIEPSPPPAVDAAEPVAVAADAAVAAVAADAMARPVSPPPELRTPLDIAMDDQRYDEVVDICSKRITPETAAACTFAACRQRAEAKARQWFGRVPAPGRARVLASCRGAGLDLAPPRRPSTVKTDAGVEDRCEVDPMACQH